MKTSPPREGPEPRYIACVCVLVTQSRASAIVALSHTSFPSVMDMLCNPPRHLAPTVGQAMSGITFCVRSRNVDDRRVVSVLVLALGSICCIIYNTKSFADMGFTGKGTLVTFGDFHVYVVVAAKEYPEEVYSCLAPSVFDLRHRRQ